MIWRIYNFKFQEVINQNFSIILFVTFMVKLLIFICDCELVDLSFIILCFHLSTNGWNYSWEFIQLPNIFTNLSLIFRTFFICMYCLINIKGTFYSINKLGT